MSLITPDLLIGALIVFFVIVIPAWRFVSNIKKDLATSKKESAEEIRRETERRTNLERDIQELSHRIDSIQNWKEHHIKHDDCSHTKMMELMEKQYNEAKLERESHYQEAKIDREKIYNKINEVDKRLSSVEGKLEVFRKE